MDIFKVSVMFTVLAIIGCRQETAPSGAEYCGGYESKAVTSADLNLEILAYHSRNESRFLCSKTESVWYLTRSASNETILHLENQQYVVVFQPEHMRWQVTKDSTLFGYFRLYQLNHGGYKPVGGHCFATMIILEMRLQDDFYCDGIEISI